MSPFEYEYLRRFVKARSGLALGANRQAVELGVVMRCAGLSSLTDLVARLRAGDENLAARLIDAMTKRETWFFRDRAVFDALRDNVVPQLLNARRHRKTLRILSAGCSSGQEPYSLAIMLHEMSEAWRGFQIDISAIDVSVEAVLCRAARHLHSVGGAARSANPQSAGAFLAGSRPRAGDVAHRARRAGHGVVPAIQPSLTTLHNSVSSILCFVATSCSVCSIRPRAVRARWPQAHRRGRRLPRARRAGIDGPLWAAASRMSPMARASIARCGLRRRT